MKYIKTFSTVLLFFIALQAYSDTTERSSTKLKYRPFSGINGYMEFKISPKLYYVSFHGGVRHDIKTVNFLWKLRAAELCQKSASTHFVQLRYVFERVLPDQKTTDELIGSYNEAGRFVKVGGTYYAPIFIPMPGSNLSVNAPTINHYVYCIDDVSKVLKEERTISVSDIIKQGREHGWLKHR